MLGSLGRSRNKQRRGGGQEDHEQESNANKRRGRNGNGEKQGMLLQTFRDEHKEPQHSRVSSQRQDSNDDHDDDEHLEYPDHDGHNALIYSAPTVDTLGDESALIRPYPTPRTHSSRNTTAAGMDGSASALRTPTTAAAAAATPTSIPSIPTINSRSETPLRHNTSQPPFLTAGTPPRTRNALNRSYIPSSPGTNMPSLTPLNNNHHHHRKYNNNNNTTRSSSPSIRSTSSIGTPKKPGGKPAISSSIRGLHLHPPSSATTSMSSSRRKGPQPQQKPKLRKTTTKTDRDFQYDEDAMAVSVRAIPIAERSAFDIFPPPSAEEWHVRAAKTNGGKRLSPSLQHLQLLHKLQSITHIRQLAFSPSVGLSSDIFYPWDAAAAASNVNEEGAIKKKRKNEKRDGRYRSIDPVQATVAALPSTPPLLSNKKPRLPLRSDVGFPNASIEEIDAKQKEIANETEWEEASPRLVVLVTSDDLGTAVQDDYGAENSNTQQPISRRYQTVTVTNQPSYCSRSSGLDGMPWAGPELQMAIEQNKRHFSRNNKQNTNNNNEYKKKKQVVFLPSPTSMLAPPLDATFSNTLGWRPRPFHDRHPGMSYVLACPIELEFDVGSIEPLLCSLALYRLPIVQSMEDDGDEAIHGAGSIQPPFGKISEEFWFPAGDWKGRVKASDDETRSKMDVEAGRKHKALFSYDPLKIFPNVRLPPPLAVAGYTDDEGTTTNTTTASCGGRDTLFVVLQVYKVTHAETAAAYVTSLSGTATTSFNMMGNSPRTSGLGKRLKKHFKRGMQDHGSSHSATDSSGSFDVDLFGQRTIHRANRVLDQFGTQFMTPLCYGVSHLFSPTGDNNVSWPSGDTQTMQLYCIPSKSESQEEFCERLVKTVTGTSSSLSLSSMLSNLQDSEDGTDLVGPREDNKSVTSCTTSSSTKTKRTGTRRFMSPRRPSGKESVGPSSLSQSISISRSTTPKRSLTPVHAPTPKSVPASSSKTSISRSSSFGSLSALHGNTTNNNINNDSMDLLPISGRVRLFTSTLEVDFLQSMLVSPPELETTLANDSATPATSKKQMQKLLVDASGDSAIMMDPKRDNQAPKPNGSSSGTTQPRKRSTLVRLPKPPKPAGYIDKSEIREILFLQPRSDKSNFDIDVPPSYRSLLNLLYLYPRLLRLEEAGTNRGKHEQRCGGRYSIRIRLVRALSGEMDDDSLQALDQFYNPAPWAGPCLLNAVYTKIPGDSTLDRQSSEYPDEIKAGIPMRDEFKLRLPMVLDGSYFLQFTLLAVKINSGSPTMHNGEETSGKNHEGDCGISLVPLAQSTIPLTSTSRCGGTRDGVKVTTIIPNGCHRLKLGEFQLQLETRLMSSVHVADPTVAAALRDFPYASSTNTGSGIHIDKNIMVISRQPSPDILSLSPDKFIYPSLFASSSGSALLGHFQPLLYMHLSNLVTVRESSGSQSEKDGTGAFVAENMQSLLEIVRRIKLSLLSASGQDGGERRVDYFIKASIDAFDEGVLNSSSFKQDTDEDAASEVEHTRSNSNSVPVSRSESGEDDPEDEFDGGAIRKRTKDTLRSELDLRISRTFSAMGESSGIPFSRVAYGATKTDRMKLEAELDIEENGRFTFLVDDDETVVTAATSFAEARMAEARSILSGKSFQEEEHPDYIRNEIEESYVNGTEDETNSIEAPGPSSHLDWREYGSYPKSIAEMGLAKRVKSAAQVILAPCVTPSFTNVFSAVHTPNSNDGIASEKTNRQEQAPASMVPPAKKKGESEKVHSQHLVSPGSEIEGDGSSRERECDDFPSYEQTFRTHANCPVITLSIAQPAEYDRFGFAVTRGDFLYETILVLWLRAWFEHVERNDKNSMGHSAALLSPSVVIPKLQLESRLDDAMYSFYANMDVILPLCLKSMILRFGRAVQHMRSKTAKVLLDDDHMAILEPFVEMLSRGLMGEAMAGLGSTDSDSSLARALRSLELVLEFLVGLFAILHPAHMAVLISKYFKTLRDCETEHIEISDGELVFEWTEESLHRVRCSRQLRIRAVEKLAVLPNFIAINYPLKYSNQERSSKFQKATWKRQYKDSTKDTNLDDSLHGEDDHFLPPSGWLADLLASESLSLCALSCEAVVAEAMAHIESQSNHESTRTSPSKASSLKKRPTAALKRTDLLMFQSIAIHAITCVYELLLRRHAMDKRFQTERCRGRIAALFVRSIFQKSLASVRWLARMEATHKVRSLWLLCFVYILQEAPGILIREAVRSYCNPRDILIHRFIRLLRLSSSTFQSFIDQPRHSMFPSEIDIGISPWLLQESFNTICATTIVVVEECVGPTSTVPREQRKMIQGILDLLLHVLTTPQSCVTHLRAVGGAIQALDKFGPDMFLEITGGSFQHWIRVVLSLMNSVALSVRSIAVDFVVSLLGSTFDRLGNIDELALIFITVLPEVVAREIALYSVSGHVGNLHDVEKSIWPLRRSFADVEDANPLDDDRVDPQLAPFLAVFCRACQAVIDGVLIEMRLQGNDCNVVGTRMGTRELKLDTFDADEESLFEAASFFAPETGPLQRIRWLMTLKSLHEAKGQWVEAAETLIMCARTISDSIPHLRHVWRPSRFVLWSDSRRSLWLTTVGEEMGNPERGNEQVMTFADNFLEPGNIVGSTGKVAAAGKLPQPTVPAMCTMLTDMTKEAVALYLREEGTEELAYTRLESLLKILMGVLDDHGSINLDSGGARLGDLVGRTRYVEEEAALRRVLAKLSGDMTKLAEQLLLTVQDRPTSPESGKTSGEQTTADARRPYYVRVLLSGKKPARFQESTTIPTFLEWNASCICRVPRKMVDTSLANVSNDPGRLEDVMCAEFGKPILEALDRDCGIGRIVFRTGSRSLQPLDSDDASAVCIDVSFIEMNDSGVMMITRDDGSRWHQSKHFYYRKSCHSEGSKRTGGRPSDSRGTFVEVRVAYPFPCALSRQRSLLTSEVLSNS